MKETSWSRRRVLVAATTLGMLNRVNAQSASVQANITLLNDDEVERFLNLLATFSNTEKLLLSSDKQMNETRVVKRRTLVLDDGSRFVASNFQNAMIFEIHVIVQNDGVAWKQVWNRLIETIKVHVSGNNLIVTDQD